MNKPLVKNLLVTIGARELAAVTATLLTLALIPLDNRLIFEGDAGTVIMWTWSAVPQTATAAAAAIAVLLLVDSNKPFAWIVALAVLTLLSSVTGTVGTYRGFHVDPRAADHLGIAIKTVAPALACVIAPLWYRRRRT